MQYIFILNGLPDRKWIIDEVQKQLRELELDYPIYVTTDAGDATRYVNIYCNLKPDEEVCFVACGGSGLSNEVVNGIVNRPNKYLAILAMGGTNDFIKMYPDLKWNSIKAIMQGEPKKIDVLKVNDNYAFNTVNIGLDAIVTAFAQEYIAAGIPDPYARAIKDSVLLYRRSKIDIVADGKRIEWKSIMNSQLGNGQYCGGMFHCTPYAVPDDGLIEMVYFKPVPLLILAMLMKYFTVGKHLESRFCKPFVKYRRVRHIELRSKDLFYVSLDGEGIAGLSIDVDILDKALNLIYPKE